MAQRIAASLIKNKDEDALWQKTGRFYLAQSVLSLEATPNTLAFLEKNLSAAREDMTAARLSEEFGLSLAFYAAAKERDEIFTGKLLTDPSLQGTVAIVTGGFHTEGLSRKFRDAGISYITISPELGDGVFDKVLYEERLTEPLVTAEQASVSAAPFTAHQTLSELRNRLAQVDERFPPSLDVLLRTKNILTAVGVYKGDVSLSGLKNAASSSYAQEPDSSVAVLGKSSTFFSAESFVRQPRDSQLAEVRFWMEKSGQTDSKAMLAAETESMKKLLEDPVSGTLFDRMIEAGDILALAQNRTIDPAQLPDRLIFSKGIERFEVRNEDASLPDIEVLLQGTPRFKRFAQKYPFAIMKSGYAN
ncbi:MAG: hypothetical protein GXY29_10675, partial [Thermotogaceae bacterium]|nr:hypothetical protein [Thermotogaceae bacterium]